MILYIVVIKYLYKEGKRLIHLWCGHANGPRKTNLLV